MVVAVLAKGLPVAFVPEEFRIATMRDDVINHRCRGKLVLFHTGRAERMLAQKQLARFAPPAVISAFIRAIPRIQRMMLFTVHAVRQPRTSRMAAGALWLSGHQTLSFLRSAGVLAVCFVPDAFLLDFFFSG